MRCLPAQANTARCPFPSAGPVRQGQDTQDIPHFPSCIYHGIFWWEGSTEAGLAMCARHVVLAMEDSSCLATVFIPIPSTSREK